MMAVEAGRLRLDCASVASEVEGVKVEARVSRSMNSRSERVMEDIVAAGLRAGLRVCGSLRRKCRRARLGGRGGGGQDYILYVR